MKVKQRQFRKADMKPGFLIFTQIAIAGCGFLIYFLFALWRDSRRTPKVLIRKITPQPNKGKVIQLRPAEELRHRLVRRAER